MILERSRLLAAAGLWLRKRKVAEAGGALYDAVWLLDEARQAEYGDPAVNMARVAEAWTGVLDHRVSARDVALCMAALKLVRCQHRGSRDDHADAIAYVEIADRLRT